MSNWQLTGIVLGFLARAVRANLEWELDISTCFDISNGFEIETIVVQNQPFSASRPLAPAQDF